MKLIKEEIIEKDGNIYKRKTYSNGTVIEEYFNETPNVKTILTKAEFFGRFTFEEQNALVNYEIVIDSQEIDETEKAQRKMAMKTLWKLLDNLTEIDLNYDNILNPFAQIVSNCGLVTIDRIIEILEPMTVIF